MRGCARTWILMLGVMLPAAAAGCLGFTHNPGYFPHWIPGGDIIRTHAKPPGRAYFRNFDPKAVCLLVTPTQCNLPTRSQQVLVASVVDQDNQPRRGRRVEWMLDGPGNIVEVDESGWTAGRGYKVDNKYAVSYTDYLEHTITRGTTDTRDDFTIYPGQTWCVVSAAVPGETVVTCYAPEVFNWEKGRAFVRLTWNDTDYSFPPPAVARYGGEASLQTIVSRLGAQSGLNPSEMKVRYRVVGGPPAVLINPASGVTEARAGQAELDILADPDGKAPVRVIQPVARAGKTQIAVEILKPDPNGNGPGTVVGRTTTVVEWTAPSLSLEVQAPKAAAVDAPAFITYVLSNTGTVDSSPATVRASLPAGIALETIDPPPVVRNGSEVEWRTEPLRGGQKQEFRVGFKPLRSGTLTTNAIAQTSDGLRAESKAITEVGNAGMKLTVEPRVVAAMGDRVPVKLLIRNTSNAVALENVIARVGLLSPGLEHDTGQRTVEATVGHIPPGQAKTVDIPVIAREVGPQKLLISATADGQLNDSAESTVQVRKAELRIAASGPEQLMPGQEATYQILVENTGEVPMPDVVVKAMPPTAISARQAGEGGKIVAADQAVWQIGTLAPGERKTVKLAVLADRVSERAAFTATAATQPKEGKGRSVMTETPVLVRGMPSLLLELAEPTQAVPVGRRAAYRVIVKNRGTGPARQVRVTVEIPEEYANAHGIGPNREDVKPEGSSIPFPVLKELAPGATATFYVEVEGARVGEARVRAEVKSDSLTQPLREEQSTRVIDRR